MDIMQSLRTILLFGVWLVFAVGCSQAKASPAEQIAQGEQVFTEICASCHTTGVGPELKATTLASYGTAEGLFKFVRASMPQNAPGSLESQQYWDVIAFLLTKNELMTTDTYLNEENAGSIPLTK